MSLMPMFALLLCFLLYCMPSCAIRISSSSVEGRQGNFEAFVINRDVDVERYQRFDEQARLAGLNVTRFPAIDKDMMDLQALVEGGDISLLVKWRMDASPRVRGTYACALSHIRLYSRLASAPSASAFLIFEDDSKIPVNFQERLQRVLKSAPSDWDMLYLNHNGLVGRSINELWLKPKNNPGKGKNALHNAYLVTQAGAKRILDFLRPYSYYRAKDAVMRTHFNRFNAYFLKPKLVPTSGSRSVRLVLEKEDSVNSKLPDLSRKCDGNAGITGHGNATDAETPITESTPDEADQDAVLLTGDEEMRSTESTSDASHLDSGLCFCDGASLFKWMPEFGDSVPDPFEC